MKKLLTIMMLCLSLFSVCYADQDTTVLSMPTKCFNAKGIIPYIDGTADEEFERKANGVIMNTVREIVKQVGSAGSFSYSVQLNRPSLVSVLLKAQNGSRVNYKALNLDLTTGRDAVINEFFVNDDSLKNALGKFEGYVFTEEGVFLRNSAKVKYTRFVPYSEILTSVRIGEAGRLFKIARLTRKSEKKILHIAKNNLFAIQLDSNPTTGYRWEAELPKDGQIMKVASSFVIPKPEDQQVGTPGKEILFFYTTAPGSYDITFRYKRGWEKFNVDEFVTTVAVRE